MMSNKQMIVRAGLRRCMYRQSANRPQEQQSWRAVEISAPAVSSDDRSRSPLRGGEGRGTAQEAYSFEEPTEWKGENP